MAGVRRESFLDRDIRGSDVRALAVFDEYDPVRCSEGGQLRCRAIAHALRWRIPTDVVSMRGIRKAMDGHDASCPAHESGPRIDGNAPGAMPYPGLYCAPAAGALASLVKEGNYQFVLMSEVMLYSYVPVVRSAFSRPLIIDLHNAEVDLYEDMTVHPAWEWASHLPDRTGSALPAMRAVERMMVEAADVVTVPSARDRDRLRGRYGNGTAISVIPNAIGMSGSKPPDSVRVPRTCAFVGSLHYFPNVLAVLDIARAIGPAIRDAVPAMKVVVAGRTPPPFLVAALRESPVELSANPDDVRPFFQDSVQIVPLTVGGGTRLKILEAFAYGSSVISTDKGIEGIAAEAGIHYLRAATPVQFADAVCEVIRDPVADLRRRRAAWYLAASEYSWTALDAPVRDLLAWLEVPRGHL